MKPRTIRSLIAAAGSVPVALVAAVALAPSALAAPVDAATFSGTFHSTCTLPEGPEGPESGPYSCAHTATSIGCAAVADTGPVTAYVKVCHADLTSGSTSGSATPTPIWFGYWTCDNGAGTGTFRYQPSSADPAFVFPVNLAVIEGSVVISGSYTQAGTGRTIVVRAHFPAICAYDTTAGDYAGDVTPV